MNTPLKIFIITLLCFSSALNLFGQDEKTLSGIVLNDAKEPISQVTINIPGTDPVYTGDDGKFTIPRTNEVAWLYVKPLEGYKNKRILLTNQQELTIYLTSLDIDSRFDMVLNQGDDMERRDLISSFKTLNTSEFENVPNTTVDQFIQGRVAGAHVVQNSGMPGSGASVFLRGYSSILSNNQPLYVVDGVPLENSNVHEFLIEGNNTSPIATIDPLDITEITVLKDASATAIYGAKAANGVVMIKTLEPRETRTTIDVMYRTGLSLAPKQLPQLDAKAYKTLANEVLFSSPIDEEVYKLDYPGLFVTKEDDAFTTYSHNYNWQDEIFRNAMSQNLRFSIKGGDAIAKYGLSVGYLKNNGVMKNTSLDRINIRLVGVFDIFSWLKMDVASSLSTSTSYLKESAVSSVTNPIMSALWKSPMLNPYEYDAYRNDKGELEPNLLQTIDEVDELGTSNPTSVIELSEAQAKNYRFFTSLNLRGDITKNLKFNALVGLNSNTAKEYMIIPDRGFDLLYNSEVERESKGQNNQFFSVYNDNKVFYNNTFNNQHQVYASVGLRWQKNEYARDYGYSRNSASDYYTNLNRGFDLLRDIGGANKRWNWGALYSSVSYAYADKYMFSATASSDISSRVGADALNTIKVGDMPVGIFYALSGAWRVSNEEFFRSFDTVEEFKIRASYGKTGNDDLGELNKFSHYKVDQYRTMAVLVPGGLANSNLTYQTKDQFNLGFDLSFWANRLYFTFDYFNNKSKNVLMNELQDSYLGYATYPNNSIAFTTSGVELEAFYRAVSQSDLKVDVGFNLSKYASIVDDIPGGEQVLDGPAGYAVINRKGEAVNSFYGYKYLGVYSTVAEAQEANLVNDINRAFGAGDAIYYNQPDADGQVDNVINKNDRQILGSFEPDFFGGLFANVRYKNFSLNMFLQGSYGNEVFNYVRQQNEKMSGLENQSVKVLQRWQYEGQETMVPKATWGDPQGNSTFSDRWIEDASYLRLRSLTLSYDIDHNVMGVSGIKVFATANNLFTLSKYKGYDTEFSYNPSLYMQGVDYGNTPIAKQFMLGVKIGL